VVRQASAAEAPAQPDASHPRDPRRRISPTVQHVLLYGVVGAVLTAVLQLVEYRWLIIGHSFEIYAALVAVLFTGVGVWAGRSIAARRTTNPSPAAPTGTAVSSLPPFERDAAMVARSGLTARELEILAAIAAGLSNREIGAQLHVSENTVKTHSSRIFGKLGVQRRVQAVQTARKLGLLP
jgi:DNA-binding CsgD family transcriptional regulator